MNNYFIHKSKIYEKQPDFEVFDSGDILVHKVTNYVIEITPKDVNHKKAYELYDRGGYDHYKLIE